MDEKRLKKLMGLTEAVAKDDLLDLGSKRMIIIKDHYYGVLDNLPTLVDNMQEAAKANPAFNEEYKIWKKVLELSNKSKLGKFL